MTHQPVQSINIGQERNWFSTLFLLCRATVWLSTAPTEPLTHWYQVRCLLQTPLFAKEGETLSGKVLFVANKR